MPPISHSAVSHATPSTPVLETRVLRSPVHRHAWQLLIVAFLLFCTRIAGLDRQSLWFDEGYTLALANASSVHGFLHTFGIFTTSEHLQPLYYSLIFLWSRFAGTSDFALRFPSVLFSVASGMLVFLFARQLVDDAHRAARWFPIAAVAAYGLSSFSFYYAQEARPYALLQLVSFLVVCLWSRARRLDILPSARVMFPVACVLATLTSPFAALLVFSLAFADLLLDAKRWGSRWKWTLIASGSAFVGYLLLGRMLLPSFIAHDVIGIRQPLWMNFGYALFGLFFGTTLGPSTSLLRGANKFSVLAAYWPILLASGASVAAMAGGATRILRQPHPSASPVRVLALATALNGAFLFIVFGVIGHLNVLPRHASTLFTLLFLFCMACMLRAASGGVDGRYNITVGIAGVLALNFISVLHYWSDPSYRKDDYRAVAHVVQQESGISKTPVFLVSGNPELLHHYGASPIDASNIEPSELAQFLLTHSRSTPTIQLVFNEYRGYRWNQSAPPSWVIRAAFDCSDVRRLAYMELLTCRRIQPNTDQANDAPPLPTRGVSYAR